MRKIESGFSGLCLVLLSVAFMLITAGTASAVEYSPGVITGQIVDTNGKPVPGASVTAYDDDSTSRDELIGRVTTDANGRYTIRIPKRTQASQWDGPKTSLHTQWRPDIYITVGKSGYRSVTSRTYSDHKLRDNLRIDARMQPLAAASPSTGRSVGVVPRQPAPATRMTVPSTSEPAVRMSPTPAPRPAVSRTLPDTRTAPVTTPQTGDGRVGAGTRPSAGTSAPTVSQAGDGRPGGRVSSAAETTQTPPNEKNYDPNDLMDARRTIPRNIPPDPRPSIVQEPAKVPARQPMTPPVQEPVAGQYSSGNIFGKITDTGNKPVAGVLVTAYDNDSVSKNELIGRATTDSNGRYLIRVPKRTQASQWDGPKTSHHTQWRPDIFITAEKEGYETFKSRIYSDHRLKEHLILNGRMAALAQAPQAPSVAGPRMQMPDKRIGTRDRLGDLEARTIPDKRYVGAPPSGSYARCSLESGGDFPIPRVTNYGPLGRHYQGMEIAFNGTNFIPDKFTVCLDNIELPISSRSDTRIVAKLPEQPMTGRLIVSHGTSNSVYPLDESYMVYGDPIISAVSPSDFQRGELVTVSGSYLFGAPAPQVAPDSASRWIKIGDSPSWTDSGFVRVSEWQINEDGSRITFRPLDVYRDISHGGTLLDPQPSRLTGSFRLQRAGTSAFETVGPTVTLRMPTLAIDRVLTPQWGNVRPGFIIAQHPTQNTLQIEGSNLNGAEAQFSGRNVLESFSAHGESGFIQFPMATPSGYVTVTKDGQTARSPQPVTVIPAPSFLPGSVPNPWAIPLDQPVELRGWDLKPPSDTGLNYEFLLSGFINNQHTACRMQLTILEHTASVIRFQVGRTGDIPEVCYQGTLFGGGGTSSFVAQIKARFNGVERELWRTPYHLSP